jgi:hypothetical protein
MTSRSEPTAELVEPEWTPPIHSDVHAASERLQLGLSTDQIEFNVRLAPAFAPAHSVVAQWSEAVRTPPATVAWRPGSDPWNATEVELADSDVACGPLADLSVAVKSTVAIANVPFAAGSRLVDGHLPVESATVVDRARAAGARITHTGRTDDLCLAITGDQGARGPVLNPWSRRHTTWGSSAGAAALVAARRVRAAIPPPAYAPGLDLAQAAAASPPAAIHTGVTARAVGVRSAAVVLHLPGAPGQPTPAGRVRPRQFDDTAAGTHQASADLTVRCAVLSK